MRACQPTILVVIFQQRQNKTIMSSPDSPAVVVPAKVGAKVNKVIKQTRTGAITHGHKIIPGAFEMEDHYCTFVCCIQPCFELNVLGFLFSV
jgi:hypothetical protein